MRKGRAAFEDYRREADIESTCRDWCIRYGYRLTKLTSKIGDADRLLTGSRIAPACMYVEFKTTTGKPSPAQVENRKRLRRLGYTHMIVDSVADFKALVRELNSNGVPRIDDNE